MVQFYISNILLFLTYVLLILLHSSYEANNPSVYITTSQPNKEYYLSSGLPNSGSATFGKVCDFGSTSAHCSQNEECKPENVSSDTSPRVSFVSSQVPTQTTSSTTFVASSARGAVSQSLATSGSAAKNKLRARAAARRKRNSVNSVNKMVMNDDTDDSPLNRASNSATSKQGPRTSSFQPTVSPKSLQISTGLLTAKTKIAMKLPSPTPQATSKGAVTIVAKTSPILAPKEPQDQKKNTETTKNSVTQGICRCDSNHEYDPLTGSCSRWSKSNVKKPVVADESGFYPTTTETPRSIRGNLLVFVAALIVVSAIMLVFASYYAIRRYRRRQLEQLLLNIRGGGDEDPDDMLSDVNADPLSGSNLGRGPAGNAPRMLARSHQYQSWSPNSRAQATDRAQHGGYGFGLGLASARGSGPFGGSAPPLFLQRPSQNPLASTGEERTRLLDAEETGADEETDLFGNIRDARTLAQPSQGLDAEPENSVDVPDVSIAGQRGTTGKGEGASRMGSTSSSIIGRMFGFAPDTRTRRHRSRREQEPDQVLLDDHQVMPALAQELEPTDPPPTSNSQSRQTTSGGPGGLFKGRSPATTSTGLFKPRPQNPEDEDEDDEPILSLTSDSTYTHA